MGQRSKSRLASLREGKERSKGVIRCAKLLLNPFKSEIVSKSVEIELGCKAGKHWWKLLQVSTVGCGHTGESINQEPVQYDLFIP